jgi:hypothetical protein
VSSEQRETRCDDADLTAGRIANIDFYALPRIDKLERTPTGGIRIPANVGRSGVLVYERVDGSVRREYRPPSEAFAARSLKSLMDAVVTVGHPAGKLVTPESVRRHQVGHVRSEGRREGKFIAADLAVLDAAAIDRVAADDLVEVSAGYTCAFDPTPGVTPEGERYDGIQRDITYNHVALLRRGEGRAGPDVKLRIDGAEVRAEHDEPFTSERRSAARRDSITGRGWTVGRRAWGAAHALRVKRMDEMEGKAKESEEDFKTKLDGLTKERDAMKAELDATKAKLDEMSKKLGESESEEKMDAKVAERSSVIEVVRTVLGSDAKPEGKSVDALRREVITKLDGAAALLDGGKPRDAEAVRVYFDARVKSLGARGSNATRSDSAGATGAKKRDLRSLYSPPGR